MSKIKYKVWDYEIKKMYEPTEIHFSPSQIMVKVEDGDTIMYYQHGFRFLLLQYTGFKVNEIEIYKGDILDTYTDGNFQRKIIEWEKGSFFLGDEHLIDVDFTEWKIVGNIYENPELKELK